MVVRTHEGGLVTPPARAMVRCIAAHRYPPRTTLAYDGSPDGRLAVAVGGPQVAPDIFRHHGVHDALRLSGKHPKISPAVPHHIGVRLGGRRTKRARDKNRNPQ